MRRNVWAAGAGLFLLAACSKDDSGTEPAGAQAYVGTYTGIWREQTGSVKKPDSVYKDTSYPGSCEIRLVDSGRSFAVLKNGVVSLQFKYDAAAHDTYRAVVYDLTVSPKKDSLVWGFHQNATYSGASGQIPWFDERFYGKR